MASQRTDTAAEKPLPKGEARQENPLVSLAFNIALPALILYKFSGEDMLGPVWGLIVGLAFPLGYGLWDFATSRRKNFISALGFISVLLTGGFGLMELSGIWFAVKEAAIPALIGIAVVVSLWTRYPLVKTLLLNEKVLDVPRVHRELEAHNNEQAFEKLLVSSTWILAASFLLSAVLNFVLAVMILQSPSGTPEFNQELGKMTALSYPVIVIPCMIVTMIALWRLLSGIKKLTGLELEDIFKGK